MNPANAGNAGTVVTVAAARAAATDWVRREAVRAESFRGAFLSGSTTWLPDTAELPLGSDVDVMVVLAADEAPPKVGKFRHDGVLLEATYLPLARVSSADEVLSSYHLAGAFRRDTVVADPYGVLRPVQAEVARRFADPVWVRRRRLEARDRIERGLRAIDSSAGFAQQVTSWLFPTGVTTHVLLVAALRNPTIRLRYPAARATLLDFGQSSVYPELLRLLGALELGPERVAHHVAELERTFDPAAERGRTPFFFSSDISPVARSIAIDASRAQVRAGDHREAMFWIVATFARCHTILAVDAPEIDRERMPAFTAAVADLGIESTQDLIRRAGDVLAFVPELWRVSDRIQEQAVEAAAES